MLKEARAQTIALEQSLNQERVTLRTTKQLWEKDKELSVLKDRIKSVEALDKRGPNIEETNEHLDLSRPNPVAVGPPAYGSVCNDSNKIPYGGTNVDSQSYIRGAMDMLQRSQETHLKQVVNGEAVNSDAMFPSSVVIAPTRTETISIPIQTLSKQENRSGSQQIFPPENVPLQ